MRRVYYIDLFSGAGGTTTGVHLAGAEVVACVNHDEMAIESHKANHPNCVHFIEDIRDFKVVLKLKQIVERLRNRKEECVLVLWASLECTNYSKAKGGQPRDADSRTLADHLFMYLEELKPDYLQIENVREFMSWGPLDENGRPVSRKRGVDYIRWVDRVKSYGFDYDWRILNAADYGAYQSRERYFGQFAGKGFPIVWPEPTHAKDPNRHRSLFAEPLKRWRAVKEVLNLDDVGESIFGRKRPLVEATLKRIYAGLIKFVAGGEQQFLIKYNSMNQRGKYVAPDMNSVSPVVSTQGRMGIVYTTSYYGNGRAHSLDDPNPTLSTRDRFSLIRPCFMDNQYGKGGASGLESVNGAVTTNPKQAVVSCEHFLMNPQFADKGRSIENPCFTLIAKMDKRPPYLINIADGYFPIAFEDSDTPMLRKVKEFMRMYQIVDIKMRMLRVPELLRIQGFPAEYVLKGTQADQKKFIGNAVEVNMSRALAVALCDAIKGGASVMTRLTEKEIEESRRKAYDYVF